MLKINPWLKIWVSPRETIRAVIQHDPRYGFCTLSFIYGFLWMLSMCQALYFGHYYGVLTILIVSLVLSIPIGYTLLSFSTFLFYFTAKVFKGQAKYFEVRAALSFSRIPYLISLLTWVVLMVLYKDRLFMADKGGGDPFFEFFDVVVFIQMVVPLWSSILFILALAEAEKFSIFRSIGTFILVICIFAFFALIMAFFIGYYSKPGMVALLESF